MKPNKNYHGGTKLITSDEDANLARFFNDIRAYEALDKETEKDLILDFQEKGSKESLDLLIKSNLKFVVRVAKTYQGQGVPLMDIIQEGSMLLVEAAKRFDTSKNLKFFSYAVWWIKAGIISTMSSNKRVISLPSNRELLVLKIGRKIQELNQKFERPCTLEEVKKHFKECSLEDIEEAYSFTTLPVSLFEKIGDFEDDQVLMDTLVIDENNKVEENLTKESLHSDLNSALFHLPQKTYDVFIFMFGLNGEEVWNSDKLIESFSHTNNKLHSLRRKGLLLLKKHSEGRGLNEYL